MWHAKDVYYISESTGILAEEMGKSLICQFPEISFNMENIPFIKTLEDARKAIEYILSRSGGRYPLVFSTIMDQELIAVLDISEVELFSFCDEYLGRLEHVLEAKPIRISGSARHLDDSTMGDRVKAIHYCIAHDDGSMLKDYDEAEVILLGVSRSGKTPISVYLATQMGIKAANYPLVAEDLDAYRLPPPIVRNKARAIGLSTDPKTLSFVRGKRYKDSNYAKMDTCKGEIHQANQIFLQYGIPIIVSDGRSIEETATQVAQLLSLKRLPGL